MKILFKRLNSSTAIEVGSQVGGKSKTRVRLGVLRKLKEKLTYERSLKIGVETLHFSTWYVVELKWEQWLLSSMYGIIVLLREF